MAVSCHSKSQLIAVAFASDMIRIYEPSLKPTLLKKGQDEFDESRRQVYFWNEINQWKCELVQHLCWDNYNTTNPLIAASSANGTYV